MRNILLRIAFALALATFLEQGTVPAHAQFITADTTINTDYDNDAYIGQGNNSPIEYSPTVNLVPGGIIEGQVFVYNNSVLNVAGGTIANGYQIGGPTSNCVTLYDGNCVVNVDSGTVAGGMTASSGTININGGMVGGSLTGTGGTFNGGPVNTGVVNVYGGNIGGDILLFQLGTVNLYGGTIGGNLYATFGGTFNIYGQNLSETLLASDVFTLTSSSGQFLDWFYDIYSLSGTLEDGTSLANTDLYISDFITPQVNLIDVPEPGNVDLLVAVSLCAIPGFFRRSRTS